MYRGEPEQHARIGAEKSFFCEGLVNTRGRGSLLLYVSLHERVAVVLADEASLQALGQENIERLRDNMVEKLTAGDRVGVFTSTIELATRILTEKLPVQDGDIDELPNRLVIYDPRV